MRRLPWPERRHEQRRCAAAFEMVTRPIPLEKAPGPSNKGFARDLADSQASCSDATRQQMIW